MSSGETGPIPSYTDGGPQFGNHNPLKGANQPARPGWL